MDDFLRWLGDVFKAMTNDGPDGAFERFRVASQGMSGSRRPSRQVFESIMSSPTRETVRLSSDLELVTAQLSEGWFFYAIGGGRAIFETGGPFHDRATAIQEGTSKALH